MTISSIYTQYNIHPNLQIHMLRVAALAKIIIDNWNGNPLNEKAIIQACLFHDAAKIIKFKYFEGDEEHWKQVQQEMIEKYGDSDHEATIKICEEAGVSKKSINLLKEKNVYPYIDRVRKIANSDDYGLKIVAHCDARISPEGLVSLDDRYKELMQRDRSKKMDDEAKESMGLLLDTQKQIQENMRTNLSVIQPEEVEKIAKTLKEFLI